LSRRVWRAGLMRRHDAYAASFRAA